MPLAALSEAEKAFLDKVSPELQFIWSEREIPAIIQSGLGKSGYTTLGVFACMVDQRAELRTVTKTMLGLDPDEVGITALEATDRRVNVARIIDAWETSKKRISERDRIAAEQKASRMPMVLEKTQHVMLRQKYELTHAKMLDSQYPCHAMIERRLEEIQDGEPKAELMSEVISAEESVEDIVGAVLDKEGTWKTKRSTKSIPLPTTSEQLRVRIRILGVSYEIAKYKHITRAWLSTTSPAIWNQHADYILGEDVYGFKLTVQDTIVVPPWQVVMEYEQQIRKHALKRVIYDDEDIATALMYCQTNASLKEKYFSTPMAINASVMSKKRPNDGTNDAKKGNKWQKNHEGNKQKEGNKGKGRGRGKSDDKKAFTPQHKHTKTPDGRAICYRFQDNTCKGKCQFVHVCSTCLGAHPRSKCTFIADPVA